MIDLDRLEGASTRPASGEWGHMSIFIQGSMISLFSLIASSASAGQGITLEDYYEVNDIDPKAAAFVRVTEESVPEGCPKRATEVFAAEASRWTRLHAYWLDMEPPASADGHVTFRGELALGRVAEGMISLETIGAPDVFSRVEERIRSLRYGRRCNGQFSVTVAFHQPSAETRSPERAPDAMDRSQLRSRRSIHMRPGVPTCTRARYCSVSRTMAATRSTFMIWSTALPVVMTTESIAPASTSRRMITPR